MFLLSCSIDNPGDAAICDLYIVLNVADMYWFYPNWTSEITGVFHLLSPGQTEKSIMNFEWPEVGGSMDGLSFYGFLCRPGQYELVSNVDVVSFGFE